MMHSRNDFLSVDLIYEEERVRVITLASKFSSMLVSSVSRELSRSWFHGGRLKGKTFEVSLKVQSWLLQLCPWYHKVTCRRESSGLRQGFPIIWRWLGYQTWWLLELAARHSSCQRRKGFLPSCWRLLGDYCWLKPGLCLPIVVKAINIGVKSEEFFPESEFWLTRIPLSF